MSRQPSARAVRDEELKAEISRVHQSSFGVYGVRKVWRQMQREELPGGRDRVARLMADLGLAGVTRGTAKRTTIPAQVEQRPGDLMERQFTAPAPNRLWVADLTYMATWSSFCHVAYVLDAFSHRIVGWRVAASPHAELVLATLEMAIWTRRGQPLDGLIHHSDWGPGSSSPSGRRSGSPTKGPLPRSARKVTPTTTPWPNPSTFSSRRK